MYTTIFAFSLFAHINLSLKKYFTCLSNDSVLWLNEVCEKMFSGIPMTDNIEDAFVSG